MYAILIYGFPLTLLGFEWGLRTMLEVNSSGFTGPTLAAAGLSFLMPLIKPKMRKIPGHDGVVAISTAEAAFIPLLWLFVFVFLFSWSWSCYVSIKMPDHKILEFDSHLVIGGALYIISLVLTAVKEKV
jgi:energy-converting hydrogenase Eha subunit G